jgi:hypothetical protein
LKLAICSAAIMALTSCDSAVQGELDEERQVRSLPSEREVVLARLPTTKGGAFARKSGYLNVEDQCLYVLGKSEDEPGLLIAVTTDRIQWKNGAIEVVAPDGEIDRIVEGDSIELGGSGAYDPDDVRNTLVVKPWPECQTDRIWITWAINRPLPDSP